MVDTVDSEPDVVAWWDERVVDYGAFGDDFAPGGAGDGGGEPEGFV